VERHVAWCAGCRKEADELREGAAVVGLASTNGKPPAALEERVVQAVGSAAGVGRRRRRRSPLLWAAAAVAALIAVVAVSIGLSWRSELLSQLTEEQQRRVAAERQVEDLTGRIERTFREFIADQPSSGPRDVFREAQMTPAAGRQGGAGALVYSSPNRKDFTLVLVGGLPKSGLPYSVAIRDRYGTTLKAGKIRQLDADGSGEVFKEFNQNLRPFEYVLVTDADGEVVLRGTLRAQEPVPSPSG
jgi:hypothetical protein